MTGDVFAVILSFLLIPFIFWRWVLPHKTKFEQIDHGQSAKYDVAQTGSQWIPQFDSHVTEGATIYVPSGDGLYVTRVRDKDGQQLRTKVKQWVVEKKANVNLIITAPTEQSGKEWQWLVEECPERFHVYLLNRDRVTGPDSEKLKQQIAAMDTYHAVLLIGARNAMWIEAYHPVASKYAYHVEFVAPTDAAKDERLGEYARLYNRLLQGPQVVELKPRVRQKSMAA